MLNVFKDKNKCKRFDGFWKLNEKLERKYPWFWKLNGK